MIFFTVLDEKISQTVKFLIDHGADVTATTPQGFTALIYASRDGFLKTVKHLITNGAEVDAQTSFGYTALMVSFDLLIPTKIVFILHTWGESTQWISKYIYYVGILLQFTTIFHTWFHNDFIILACVNSIWSCKSD